MEMLIFRGISHLDVFRTGLVHPACGFIRADDEDGPLLLLWFAAFESMRESSGFHFDALRSGGRA
jgi:hypothetical protein